MKFKERNNSLIYLTLMFSFFLPSMLNAKPSDSCNPPITISPYLGIDQKSLVLISLYNQDVVLLQENLAKNRPALIGECPPAIFELSGLAAFLLNAKSPNTPLFTFDSAELDLASHIKNWITTFFDIAYSNQPVFMVGEINHSKIYLDRIFITFGNLNKLPFYLTVGRRYVPFGQYYSYMISGSLGQILGKTEASSMLLGYTHSGNSGWYGAIYAIKSIKKLFWDTHQKALGGYTVGFNSSHSYFNYDVGFDYIQSISAAQGFQALGIENSIPGIDVHLKTEIKNFTLTAEFTSALSRFNKKNLSYYHHGAKPAALYYELGYQLSTFNKSTSLALGYGKTYQSAELNLPSRVVNMSYAISLTKYIIFSTQYQRNFNYAAKSIMPKNYVAPGKNVLFLKLIAYF